MDTEYQTFLGTAPLSDPWFDARSTRVTASRAAAASGLSPYQSPRKLWRIMTGREDEEFNDYKQKMLDVGTYSEPFILDLFTRVTGLSVTPCGMWLSRYCPRISASPDGIVFDPETGIQSCIEVKRPHKALYTGVQIAHYVQMQMQMHCAGLNSCYYVAWHPDDGLRIWIVLFDRVLIYDVLLDSIDEFLACIDEDREPDVNSKRRDRQALVRNLVPQHSFLVYSD